jgi:hypothetical protein
MSPRTHIDSVAYRGVVLYHDSITFVQYSEFCHIRISQLGHLEARIYLPFALQTAYHCFGYPLYA